MINEELSWRHQTSEMHVYTAELPACEFVADVSRFDSFTCVICKLCYPRVPGTSGVSLQGSREIKPHKWANSAALKIYSTATPRPSWL